MNIGKSILKIFKWKKKNKKKNDEKIKDLEDKIKKLEELNSELENSLNQVLKLKKFFGKKPDTREETLRKTIYLLFVGAEKELRHDIDYDDFIRLAETHGVNIFKDAVQLFCRDKDKLLKEMEDVGLNRTYNQYSDFYNDVKKANTFNALGTYEKEWQVIRLGKTKERFGRST